MLVYFCLFCVKIRSKLPMPWLPGVYNGISWPIYDQNQTKFTKKSHIVKKGNHPFGDKFTSLVIMLIDQKLVAMTFRKKTKINFKNLDLIQLHLKLQKIYRNKKVTKNVDYYNEKGFKGLLSYAKKNYSRLIYVEVIFFNKIG